MTEAATAFWHPTEMVKSVPGSKIMHGKERKFESVENAVTFVMENLSEHDRGTAMIQTDQRSIHPSDIAAIYTGMKKKKDQ
jgi:hypothetical protein